MKLYDYLYARADKEYKKYITLSKEKQDKLQVLGYIIPQSYIINILKMFDKGIGIGISKYLMTGLNLSNEDATTVVNIILDVKEGAST